MFISLVVHKTDVCHPGGSQDEFLPREAAFKPVNCHVVKQKSRWLSCSHVPAGCGQALQVEK